MLFRKKKKMIDIRELQRRGIVRIPNKEIVVPTDKEGFVELGSSEKVQSKSSGGIVSAEKSNVDFFGFMNSSETESSGSFSTESDGYNKREVDAKITSLDNKIYRLEHRVELLERKLSVNQPSNNTGVMGW